MSVDTPPPNEGQNVSEVNIYVPQFITLFEPIGDSKLPKIILEDWTDDSYFRGTGMYLESRSGTGIFKIMENHPPCLKINETAYSISHNIYNYPKLNDDNGINTEIVFSDACINEIKMQDIEFENVGPTSIKYEWERIRNYQNDLFPIKIVPSLEQKFYFDSRSYVLLPGEKKKLGVGFKSKYTGIYKEDWEFKTKPKIHKSKIIFKFRGLAKDRIDLIPWEIFSKHLNIVESELCVKDIIEKLLRKIFDKSIKLEGPESINYVTDEEIFLYVNEDLYSYIDFDFKKLKKIYFNNFDKPWNYNLLDLEEKFNETYSSIDITSDIELIKQSKINMIKSNRNILERKYYITYNTIFELFCSMINEIQSRIDSTMRQFGITLVPLIFNENKPDYFYWPQNLKIEEIKDDNKKIKKNNKDNKKKALKSTADSKKSKITAGKKKGAKDKREYIQLVPSNPKMIYKVWSPENLDYAEEVYGQVYNTISLAIDNMVNILESETMLQKSRLSH